MQYSDLQILKNKPYFTSEDVASFLGISIPSANVLCSRYVKKGLFLRLKKNFYVMPQKFETLDGEDLFTLSNFLYVPSYISFMTALAYYEVTTQVQRSFFESASPKRGAAYKNGGVEFRFNRIDRKYYFGFKKTRFFFIASKEKAFVDAVYLASLGRYSFDVDSLDMKKLDKKKIKKILREYPQKTKGLANKLCKTL